MVLELRVASSVDTRIRVTAIELYSTLYGKLTPSCMPDQGVSSVVTLLGINYG